MRITPGLPTTRCTTSMFLLPAIAGVTVQFPRMPWTMAAAAPGWPSIALYCADCAYLPNSTIAASTPSMTPSGMSNAASPVSSPTTTAIARTATPLPITIGSALGSDLRMIPATMRICLILPIDAGSAASFAAFFDACAAAPPGFFTMGVRIRGCDGARDPRSGGSHVSQASLLDGRPVQPARSVGRADERARHDPGEPERECLLAQLIEFVRRNPASDGMVPWRRPEVLGDREQVTAGRSQVGHRHRDLVPPLAHAQDQVGLRDQARLLGRQQ